MTDEQYEYIYDTYSNSTDDKTDVDGYVYEPEKVYQNYTYNYEDTYDINSYGSNYSSSSRIKRSLCDSSSQLDTFFSTSGVLEVENSTIGSKEYQSHEVQNSQMSMYLSLMVFIAAGFALLL